MQDSTISERNLLGAALLDGSTWELAAAALPSENFSNDSHRCIHRAMAAVATRGDQISLITVSDELGRRKQLDKIGGTAYLSTLTEGVITTANHLRYCSEQIQGAAGVRHIRDTANTILKAAETGAELGELRARISTLDIEAAAYEARGTTIRKLEDIPDPFSLASERVPWLIDNLIPARAVTVLAGEPGAGKTWLALMVAKAVRLGGEFLGHSAERGEVLYLDRENPLALIRDRLEIICGGAGVLSPWGNWCQDEPPLIGDPRLLDFAKQGLLIVFDSLIRFHKAENENDASEMSKVMAHLRALANAGGTVLALHHKAKSETSSYRGSSDIAGGADAVFTLSKRDELLELRSVKHRFTAETSTTIKADFAAGRLEVTDSPAKMKRQDEIATLQDIIAKEPGLSQRQIIERSPLADARTRELLAAETGSLWQTKPGARNALLYFPRP